MQLALALPEVPPEDRLFPDDAARSTFLSLIERGALVVLSHSGGKDSQAMTVHVSRLVPPDQLLIVHAPLGEMEWPRTLAHIRATVPCEVPFVLARAAHGKSLLKRVAERGKWPDPARRWCTADFKRTPIEREIRRYLKAHPQHRGLVVSAMGLRAQESPGRARRAPWRFSTRNSRAGRRWYDWLPLHTHTTEEVFGAIRAAGQTPHWAYSRGATRVSCVFCIMGSRADLRTGARLNPELYRRYVALEGRIGHTLSPSRRALAEITGIPA